MKNVIKILLMVSGFIPVTIYAQQPAQLPDGRSVTLMNSDSMPLVHLPSVEITDATSAEALERLRAYNKLKRDVKKAYPYAKLAATKFGEMEQKMSTIKNKRERKKYVKETEKELKDQFTEELKNLTVNQGRILLKLIDRETGNTSYEVIKTMRGSFNAFVWQGFARFFGSNLKDDYDPEGEDETIESIIRGIESGEIN
ncbi:MAG: DUF4294 domain-containing protein [Bacteroidia bacterium]